jgi:hypothetical protein
MPFCVLSFHTGIHSARSCIFRFQAQMPRKKRKIHHPSPEPSPTASPTKFEDKKQWSLDTDVNSPPLFLPRRPGPVYVGRLVDHQLAIKTILDAFSLFFTDVMIQHIVDSTNERHTALAANNSSSTVNANVDTKHSTVDPGFGHCLPVNPDEEDEDEDSDDDEAAAASKSTEPWQELTRDEFRQWIAVWIVMGLCPQPSLKDYWRQFSTSNGIFGNTFIQRTMPRNRFLAIHHRLKFDIHFLIRLFTIQTKEHWRLHQWINIDDQLSLFKGRYSHRQHVRGKPHATGLKFFPLCDSTSFIWDILFCHGQKEVSSVMNVVSTLLSDVKVGDEHVLVTDAWFGTWPLALYLHKTKDIWFIMACQKNRPDWLFEKLLLPGLKKGNSRVAFCDKLQLTALAWHDKKAVCFITNAWGSGDVKSSRRDRILPAIVNQYNLHSHYVDQADAMLNQHKFKHRNRKWTQCALQTLLQIAVNNCIIYWRAVHDTTAAPSELRAKLARLLAPLPSGSVSSTVVSKQQHIIVLRPVRLANCAFCWRTSRKRKRTVFCCGVCQNQKGSAVSLHARCFATYHQQYVFQ